MRIVASRLALCSVLLCLGVGCWSAGVSEASTGVGSSSVPAFGGGLVVPSVQSLDGGQQVLNAEEAQRSNPIAVSAREASRTRFEHLSDARALETDRIAFPEAISEPIGGALRLPTGQSVLGYPGDDIAQVDLGGGKDALVESSDAMAVETSPGHRSPVNLKLTRAANGFQPVLPSVAVVIPSRLSDGVRLPRAGVSLTPVSPTGAALLGAEGADVGASVVYANTQTDTDVVAKPTSDGVELNAILRSVDSPERLYFRVGLPHGARLEQPKSAKRDVKVIEGSSVVGLIVAPQARDATGAAVPMLISVAGHVLELQIADRGQYQYPIEVDPEYWDLEDYTGRVPSNFHFIHDEASQFTAEESGSGSGWSWTEHIGASHKAGEWGALAYTTQGRSSIDKLYACYSWPKHGSHLEQSLELVASTGAVESEYLDTERRSTELCNSTGVPGEPGTNNSAVDVTQSNGEGEAGEQHVTRAYVMIGQESVPHAQFNTTSATINGQPNVMYGTSNWLGPKSGGLETKAWDEGVGVSSFSVTAENKGFFEKNIYKEGHCFGVQCPASVSEDLSYSSAIPNGEPKMSVGASNLMPGFLGEGETHTIKVDSVAPSVPTLSGLVNGSEISEGEYTVNSEATDGLSGIKALSLAVDGNELGKPGGACSGACTGKAEWQISGGELGAGEHKLIVTATDKAGNTSTKEISFKVHHATPAALGPGLVNPASGELTLSSRDVAVPSPGASLEVSRAYGSRHLAAGVVGPLGPQWRLSVGGEESITRAPNGNATLVSSTGGQTTFNGEAGGSSLVSPTGDSNLSLSATRNEAGAVTEYVARNAADGGVIRFTSTGGPGASVWEPTKQEGPLASQTVRYTYEAIEGVTVPKYAVAPEPPGVTSCLTRLEKQESLVAGCRALTFVYASATIAKGEKSSEWGAYKGRLKQVLYTAYNQATKESKPIAVAEYVYDAKGRLRAEWNPQISPTLETTYGYDAEGHVTAVNPAGEEPWLVQYGTSPADSSTGRVLSVIRPAAASPTEVKTEDELATPAITTKAPTLSSERPVVGTKISVASEGVWSNAPEAYRYQWERCASSGLECVAIPGAANQSYYPVTADVGKTLAAAVTALNPDGAATVGSSTPTYAVQSGTPNSPAPEPPTVGTSSVWTVDYQVPLSGSEELSPMTKAEVAKWGQKDDPEEATAIFPPDSPEGWPAKTYKRATVEYLDSFGRTVNVASPTGGVSTTEYNSLNDVVRSLSADSRTAALKEGCTSEKECKSAEVSKLLDTESTYEEKGSEPGTELLSTLGPQHPVELTNGSPVEARAHTVYSYDENAPKEGGPYDLVTKTTQGAVVAGVEEPESVRTTITSYSGSGSQEGLGWKLRKPISVTTDPTSANPNGLNLVHTTEYEPNTGEPVETKMPPAAGKDKKVPPTYAAAFGAKGTGAGQLEKPTYDAIDAKGNVWVTEYGSNRISEFSPSGTFIETLGWGVSNGAHELQACKSSCKEGLTGTEKGELSSPTGIAIANGLLYVVDSGNNRIEVYNEEKNEAVNQWGEAGTTAGKFKTPLAIAISPSGNVWVGDSLNRRLQEFKPEGKFIEAVGWGVIKNSEVKYQVCTSGCEAGLKGEGEGQFASTWGMAFAGSTLYVTDTGNNRVEKINEKSEAAGHFGTAGSGNGQLEAPIGIATSPTTGNLYVTDTGNNRMQVFTPSGEYLTQFASFGTGNGQLDFPEGDAINSSGEIYVVDDLNHRVERWIPTITGNEGAHNTKTVYYTAKEEAEAPECRNHPEWAALPCQTGPGVQPGTSGLPELPVTTITSYNIWDEPLTTVEKASGKTRTKTATYDNAGRLKTTSTESSEGTSLPEVSYSYTAKTGAETGAITQQRTPTTGKTITSVYNTLGQLTSYTDADENTSTYEYDEDGRIHKTNDGKGTQTYTYSKTAGLPEELVDSSHEGMKFTAFYDVEGNMVTETYPNGMTASYTYNQTGTPTSLVYKKETHCVEEKEKCQWYKDSIIPSIHGQWLTQTSNLSKQEYVYDDAGRVTQVQNTPAGKGCTTRIYAYDEDSNRINLTTREPNLKKECTTTGGTIESHTYDTADRLTDNSTAYNNFGDITTLPEADTEGGPLTNTYYVDGQAATQTQHEQTIGYNLDPGGRTRETVATGKKASDVISHYAGPGSAPSWTTNTSAETTRNIPGINGQLAAIQNNSEAPVLQLADLHGDIVATASLSETATELASKIETSEYGVPTTSTTTPKYSWLGAEEIADELPSGVLNMGARSYTPQVGRFLQPDPMPGGSADAYAYTFGDPVDSFDLTGEYVEGAYLYGALDGQEQRSIEREAAREAAAKAAAEAAAKAAAEAAARAAGPQYEEQEPLGGYGGWACEYAAETGQEGAGCGGGGGGLAGFPHGADPGLPRGARCEGNTDSKQYKKEHANLCHEIESNPWEPVDSLCEGFWWAGGPYTAAGCGIYGSGRYFTHNA